MPIHYATAKDGTVYPVYSGAEASVQVRDFYLTHAARYGYSRAEMQKILSGQKVPFSATLLARAKVSGNCCAFDPTTLHVGDVVNSMAVNPSAARLHYAPESVVGVSPAWHDVPAGAILTSGSVVRPAPPPQKKVTPGMIIAVLFVVLALSYAGHWWVMRYGKQSKNERRGPVHVAAISAADAD